MNSTDVAKEKPLFSKEREKESLQKYGHVIKLRHHYYTTNKHTYPSAITKGLINSGIGYEFELTMEGSISTTAYILNVLAEKAKQGISFETNKVYHIEELNDAPFYFIKHSLFDETTPYLRIILADAKFRLPTDPNCDPNFTLQETIGFNY